MTRWIGKRIYYTCEYCGKPFTVNKQGCIYEEETEKAYCSETCKRMELVNETTRTGQKGRGGMA